MTLDPDIFSAFARYGVSTVFEGMGQSGLLDEDWISVCPGSRIAGPARTVLCAQDDNLMVHAALERCQPGEVLVIKMPQPRPVAMMGDLMVLQALHRRVAGALIDGAVRDADEIRSIGFPVWARFVRSRTAKKGTPGTIDVPLTIGGSVINPGDIIVMDGDGAVVVPRAQADEVRARCEAREKREVSVREQIARGALTLDLNNLRAALEGRN